VEVLKALMRFFGYIYHGLLALFALAISGMAMANGMNTLQLDMLPWKGATLTYALFFGAIIGLLSVALALKRIVPALFLLWSLVIFVLLVKGYVFSNYFFDSGELKTALYLIAGALLAVIGAWFGVKQPVKA